MAVITDERRAPEPVAARTRGGTDVAPHRAWLRLCRALTVAGIVVVAVSLVVAAAGTVARPVQAGAVIGFAVVLASVAHVHLTRRRPVVLDGIEPVALLVAALVLDWSSWIEVVFAVTLGNAVVHRRGRHRLAVAAAFVVSLAVAQVVQDGAVAAIAPVVRLAVAAAALSFVVDLAGTLDRAMRRERLLGRAGRELTASGRLEDAGHITADAAYALARNAAVGGGLHTAVYVGDGDILALVAQVGDRKTATAQLLDLRRMAEAAPTDTAAEPLSTSVVFTGDQVAAVADDGTPPEFAHVLWAPLFARDRLRGIISVSSGQRPDADLREAIEALGVEAVLVLDALESSRDADARARHIQTLLAHSSDAITVLDADHVIRFESSGARLLGWDNDELVGQHAGFLPHPDDVPHLGRALEQVRDRPGASMACEWRARHRSGGWVQVETIITNLLEDDDVAGYLLNSRDITDRKQLQDELEHQALHDPLTGLPNRTLFVDRVEHAIERSKRQSGDPAVCFLNVDGFKQVNDIYGHEIADEVLTVVADRLRASLREGDTPARFGGDTFAVLMESIEESQVGVVVERLLGVVSRPLEVGGRTLSAHATVGVATPQALWGSRELLQAAESALAVAKSDGRGVWRRYDDTLPNPGDRDGLLAALEEALASEQFGLQYQPLIDLPTGRITGVEALLRWHHPELGPIPPNDFIPFAERTGLIVPIGQWVMETAIEQLCRWQQDHGAAAPASIHVNVSGVQLSDPRAVEALGAAIAGSALHPSAVTIEITESVLVADPVAANRALSRLKAVGVRLAIDDFGVGYAGLGYLREFAVDQLKIDKSFVDDLVGRGNTQLFEAMLGFSRAFRLETVAEGVEHAEQAEVLERLGCHGAQGFHFARPLDAPDLEALLAAAPSPSAEVQAQPHDV